MDEINLGSKAREERGLLASRVPSPNDADGNIAVEGAIAGRARRESVTNEIFLVLDADVTGRSTTGNDEGLRLHPCAIHFQTMRSAGFEILDHAVLKTGTEFLRLLLHSHDEVWSIHAFRKAGEIFDGRGGGELTPWHFPLKNERRKIRAGGVNGGSETGTSRADNNDIFHRQAE